MNLITSLADDSVFVFGSNASGHHGAGAAGFACRGTAVNNWRDDPWFRAAMAAPVGHPDRVGKWAVYGVARGPQKGREGKSYAIQTIVRGGLRRSVPLADIQQQFEQLCTFARERPLLKFLMTPVGANLAGYTNAEMLATFKAAIAAAGGKPANLIVPDDLYV